MVKDLLEHHWVEATPLPHAIHPGIGAEFAHGHAEVRAENWGG